MEAMEKIVNIIAEQFGVSAESMKSDTRFEDDLGADSLDVAELVVSLEEEFGITIEADEKVIEIATIGDMCEAIEKLI